MEEKGRENRVEIIRMVKGRGKQGRGDGKRKRRREKR